MSRQLREPTKSKTKKPVKDASKSPARKSSKAEKEEKPKKTEKSDKKTVKTKETKSSSDKTVKKTSNKENSKPKTKERKRTPSPKIEEPEYEDDFEDYSDDFESDLDVEAAAEKTEEVEIPEDHPDEKEEEITPKEDHPVSEDTWQDPPQESRPNTTESHRVSENDTVPLVEKVDTPTPIQTPEPPVADITPMMKRLQSRQGGRAQEAPPIQEKPSQKLRVSSADRKINFNNARTIDVTALTESEKRFQKLRELISFDSSRHVILDQPPVREHEFYMQLFAGGGKKQTACQTGEDDVQEGTQTETPHTENIWTQHPATDQFGSGTDELQKGISIALQDTDVEMFRENYLQNARLQTFVQEAAQVIIDLMSSNTAESELLPVKNRSQLEFSAGYHSLSILPIAQSSRVTAIARNSNDSKHLLVANWITETVYEHLKLKTLLVEFYLDNSQPPKRLYLADGEVLSMVYSHDGNALFAGLKDGSVLVYDLFESEELFPKSIRWTDSTINIALRTASFDTSYLSSTLSIGNASPIVQISLGSDKKDSTQQICCLDQSGTICIFSLERGNSDQQGQRPTAQLFLNLVAMVKPDAAVIHSSSQPTSLIATCLLVKTNPIQFLVGTDSGFLCNVVRGKSAAFIGPRIYKSNMNIFGEVTSVQLSPFEDTVLLVGMSSGSISINRIGQSAPLIILTPPANARKAVTSLEWSKTNPYVFYSIHGGLRLLMWNLSVAKTPQYVNDLTQQSDLRVEQSLCWYEQSKSATTFSYMALGLRNGEVEVHLLEPVKAKSEIPLGKLLSKINSI